MSGAFDVIVVGTGAGGGMAIKALTDAGLNVCALNAGPRLDPATDFRFHKMPFETKFRGFGDPRLSKATGYNEYTPKAWETEIPFTTGEDTDFSWRRCFAVGGKTNFWGRSAARYGEIDFKAATLDGVDVDWPVSYEDIAPYYSRVEKMIGVASAIRHLPGCPDGEFLPPMNFRCSDRMLEAACKKLAINYIPDRIAQLTVDHNGFPKCHFCGGCDTGCDTGSFFSTPWRFLPDAERTGKLDLRTNALAKNVIVDEQGHAKGVLYVDRTTRQVYSVYGRAVILAASCLESSRIMLNSKSSRWPNGIANSSGQVGRNLVDHLMGTPVIGFFPQLLGQPSFPDNVSTSQVGWIPRFTNLTKPKQEEFVRGYSLYPEVGCAEFPEYADYLRGYGVAFKKDIKRYYRTPVSFYMQIPTLPSLTNFMDVDPVVQDPYGIPVARFHFQWGQNELKMWEHSKRTVPKIIKTAGGQIWDAGLDEEPDIPGSSLHESGTCRMGNDPKKFVTNSIGQTHDVHNLFLCDASVFPTMTDKTTTLSILAFSLRTSEHLIRRLKRT